MILPPSAIDPGKRPLAPRLQGLAPVLDERTRLIVLGSFPGAASLQARQYYAHPRNRFWPVLGTLWGLPLPTLSYPERLAAARARGLGLWDVYAACERVGSLDADIRHAECNDLAGLRTLCPALQALAHNGAESHRHVRRSMALGLPVHRLPSTSPANAAWSLDRLARAWGEVFERYGVGSSPASQAPQSLPS